MPRTVVHLAGSPGGHLDLLAALATGLGDDVDRVWVTGPGRRADDLLARGETVRVVPDTGRAIRPLVRNVLAAGRLVLRTRPRLVTCSGGGLARGWRGQLRVARRLPPSAPPAWPRAFWGWRRPRGWTR